MKSNCAMREKCLVLYIVNAHPNAAITADIIILTMLMYTVQITVSTSLSRPGNSRKCRLY